MTSCTAEMVHSSTLRKVSWHSIDWKRAGRDVRRLQMRIAKAVKEGDDGRVKALQWTLTHSFYAKALAVKRVTSNKADANPYMPEYGRYFWLRRHVKDAKLLPTLSARQMRLAF